MMKRFREKLKSADFGSKNYPFPHFEHTKCLPKMQNSHFYKNFNALRDMMLEKCNEQI